MKTKFIMKSSYETNGRFIDSKIVVKCKDKELARKEFEFLRDSEEALANLAPKNVGGYEL
jgi:hypothetical protein